MLLPPQSRAHKYFAQCSEVGTAGELFCENLQYVEFTGNVEDLYLVGVDELTDMFIMDNDVLHSICCEIF